MYLHITLFGTISQIFLICICFPSETHSECSAETEIHIDAREDDGEVGVNEGDLEYDNDDVDGDDDEEEEEDSDEESDGSDIMDYNQDTDGGDCSEDTYSQLGEDNVNSQPE